MAKLEIDLVDTKTEDENQQREDTKPGIFHDATNIKKEMDANKQNERDVKMENGLQNTNRHCEISAKHENLNTYETEKVGIKSKNVQNQHKNEENLIDFSIPETIGGKLENEEITSYVCMKHILALLSWGQICINNDPEAFTFAKMEVGHPVCYLHPYYARASFLLLQNLLLCYITSMT